MRYIDQTRAVRKRLETWDAWDDWQREVKQLNRKLEAAGDHKTRRLLLNKSNPPWSKIKHLLKEASFGKCWYCECRLPERQGEVDHFRPKARVSEDKEHPGYWWLAFDWTNFRLACDACNRFLGKRNHFPLMESSQRACEKHRDCSAERPGLLDPTCRSDVRVVDFVAGRRQCTSSSDEERQRYELSKKHYDWQRRSLCVDLFDLHLDLKTALDFLEVCENPHEQDRLLDKMMDLLQADKPYSHAGKCFLSSLKTPENQVFVDEILKHT